MKVCKSRERILFSALTIGETDEQRRYMVCGDSSGIMRDRRHRLPSLAFRFFRSNVRPIHSDRPRSKLREYANILDVCYHSASNDTIEPLRHYRNGESGPGLSHRTRYCPL